MEYVKDLKKALASVSDHAKLRVDGNNYGERKKVSGVRFLRHTTDGVKECEPYLADEIVIAKG